MMHEATHCVKHFFIDSGYTIKIVFTRVLRGPEPAVVRAAISLDFDLLVSQLLSTVPPTLKNN